VSDQCSSELRDLFDADQTDRREDLQPGTSDRDEERLARVHKLIEDGSVRTAEDHFHAAMVLQHTRIVLGVEDARRHNYLRAHDLARRAAELGHPKGRWLAAATYDRWLMTGNEPQRYGTQYHADGGRWALWPVDPATTDEEREAWDVPTLATARKRADDMTRLSPPRPRRES
jgi:hypothetical protein